MLVSDYVKDYGPSAALAVAIVFMGFAAPLFHRAPAEALRASYSLSSNTSEDPKFDVLDIYGGRRLSGILVVSDDADAGAMPEGLVRRIGELKETFKSELASRDNYLEPPPPLPFALFTAPVLRRVPQEATADYGSYSNRTWVGPPILIRRPDVEAWRIKFRPWNLTEGLEHDSFFISEARPLMSVDGKLVPLP